MYRFLRRISGRGILLPSLLLLLLTVTKSYSQCAKSWDFSIIENRGCFATDPKTGKPLGRPVKVGTDKAVLKSDSVSIQWDFGDGNGFIYSGDTTYSPNYLYPGVYKIRLLIKNKNGDTCTDVTHPARLLGLGTPTFRALQTKFCTQPFKITLKDSTQGAIFKRKWIVTGTKGVAYTHSYTDSTGNNLDTFTLPSAGTYDVRLQVEDSFGCSKSVVQYGYLYMPAPLAVDICASLTTGVTASGRDSVKAVFKPNYLYSGLDTTGATYLWNFGDGNTSSSMNATHQYTGIDSTTFYPVSLTVTLKNGCKQTYTADSMVTRYFNTKDIPNNVYCINSPAVLHLTKGAFTAGKGNYAFNTSATSTRKTLTSDLALSSYSFPSPGLSDMTFGFKYGSTRCGITYRMPGAFNILPPKADFSSPDASNVTCKAGAQVHVKSTDKYPGATYTWTVFDTMVPANVVKTVVSTTDTATIPFSSSDSGYYSVQLKVSAPNGGKLTCEDSILKTLFISINRPQPKFTLDVSNVCNGKPIHTTNLTTPKDKATKPYQYTWTATRRAAGGKKKLTVLFSGDHPDITLDSFGTWDISLTALVAKGCAYTNPKSADVTVNVFGISAKVEDSAINTCPGSAKVKVKFKIIDQYPSVKIAPPMGPKAGRIWSVTPSSNVTFSPTNATTLKNDTSPVVITLDTAKSYDLSLLLVVPFVGSASCSTTVNHPAFVHLGTQAKFTHNKFACINIPLQLTDGSMYGPDVYKYSVIYKSNSKAKAVIDTPSNANPHVTFSDTGVYVIQQEVSKGSLSSTCYSTYTDTVFVTRPTPYFYSNQLSYGCAPQLVVFDSVYPKKVVSYYWSFGDKRDTIATYLSTTHSDPIMFHQYETNNIGGFTIMLKVTDENGCSDSFTRKNYIMLHGPVPEFKFAQDSVCGSSTVKIINLSQNIAKMSLDFRDLSPIDTIMFDTIQHSFTFNDFSKPENKYYPILIASDKSKGTCYSTYKDSITLFRPTHASFRVTSATSGCAPVTVTFEDQSSYNNRKLDSWDMDGDGTIDVTGDSVPSYTYTKPGIYTVRFFANTGHCTDSAVMTKVINVYGIPKADFTVDDTAGCPSKIYTFTPSSKNEDNSIITSYTWDYGDSITDVFTITGSSTDSIPTHKYNYGGPHSITLVISNANGCADTIVKPNLVRTTPIVRPPAPEVLNVTIDNEYPLGNGTGNIIVRWKKDGSGNFTKYDLYRSDITTPLLEQTTVLPDTFADITPPFDVNSNSYGYTMTKTDFCGFTSFPSPEHRTILLKASPNPAGSSPYIKLVWTPYKGWESIGGPTGYQIWKKETGDPAFHQIATIKKNTSGLLDTEFVDNKKICNGLYRYIIVALHPNQPALRSVSNTDSTMPNYTYQDKPLDLLYATTYGNYVKVKWTGGKQKNAAWYIIDRKDTLTGHWTIGYDSVSTKQDSFIDKNVSVDAQAYMYRVKVRDSCGNITDGKDANSAGPSNAGTSVYFTGAVSGDCPAEYFGFKWNNYQDFSAGINHYVLQLQDNKGKWYNYKTVEAKADSTADDSIHLELDGPACYRIMAVSNPDSNDNYNTQSSISNESCFINCSRVYMPDAFSPNADGVNDSFAVSSVAVFNNSKSKDLQFTFTIYDRWGSTVFQTSDIHAKWGGDFNNDKNAKACPADIYIYQLEAHGMDSHKSSFFKRGVITLIR